MTPKKFILASSAKWFEMLIIILVNIFSVPIILSKWGPETFGAWILLQGVMVYVNLPNIAFQEYIHNKNLKLGFKKKKKISINIISAAPITISISLLIILFLILELNFQFLTNNLNIPNNVKNEWSLALFLFGVYSIFTYSINPLLTHTTHIFGYLALFTWIGVLRFLFSQSVILLSISFYNASLIQAFIGSLVVQITVHSLEYIIVFFIFKKEKLKFVTLSFKHGFENFFKSLWLTFTFLIDNISSNGLRIIIIALSNPATLVIFATIRTITNTLMHALESIRQPFLTGIMKNFSSKSFNKININFEIYFLFISTIVFPVIILLHLFIQSIYTLWTLGNVEFNFYIYTLLITSVLIVSLNFPFRIIISGNNLVKEKFNISLLKNVFLILFIFSSFDQLKIMSFGIGILLSEILEIILNYLVVKKFFRKIKFNLKEKLLKIVIINFLICTTILSLFVFTGTSSKYDYLILPCFICYPIIVIIMFKKSDKNTKMFLKNLFIKR